MNMPKKPKGKVPSLIGGSLGAPRRTKVERTSPCKRCAIGLPKGLECFEIPQLRTAFTTYKRYCDPCFDAILAQTQADLDELRQPSV
jgi:hypothetical protein